MFAAPVGRCTTADPITPGGVRPFVKVCELDELRRHGDRVHVLLGDRHVSLIFHRGEVYCLDSLCYHAGGPLGIGDIEDVGGRACLSCPWHLYKVTAESGEKLYGSTRLDEATGSWSRTVSIRGSSSARTRWRSARTAGTCASSWTGRTSRATSTRATTSGDRQGSESSRLEHGGTARQSLNFASSPRKITLAAASESRVARSLER